MGRLLGLVLTLSGACASARAAEPSADALAPELVQAVDAVRWNEDRVERLIHGLPKAELHVHLDGALSPELVARLAAAVEGSPLAGKAPAELAKVTVVSEARPTLAQVLDAFKAVYPLLRSPWAVREAAYELVRRAARSNVRYVEVRFAPELQAAPGFTAEDALKAALDGLAAARKDFGVRSGVILCVLRPDGLMDMRRNEATVDLAITYQSRGVVGVDLAGDEAAAPLSAYAPLLRKAKAAGLGVTAHAGEVPGSKDVAAALELGADRLGHATLLADDPESLREVVRRRVPIEVNLTSNLRTSAVKDLREHPARAWSEAGIPLAVSTDDPGVFDVELDGEYRLLHAELGFGPRRLIETALQSFDAAFLPAAEKRRLRESFAADARLLLAKLAADRY